MATQKGMIKLNGTIDDLTFYESKYGYIVKKKTIVSKDRIAKDASFARTRENAAEFAEAIRSGKLLRNAIRPLLVKSSDSGVVPRITKLMSDIRKLDGTSARGKRTVGTALALAPAQTLLQGLNFNKDAVLGTVLFKPYSITPATGAITIANLIPTDDMSCPEGATHVALSSAWASVDFTTRISNVQYSPPVNLLIDTTSTSVTLTPAAPVTGTGTNLFLLQIEFFQLVNGVQYPLNNGSFNALEIVQVA